MTWKPESRLNWDEIIETIQLDDLEKFKNYHLPTANINLPLTHSKKLIPKHGDQNLPYYCPDEVAVLSFIILCEAKNILIHINKNLYPDYGNLYDGHAPIHFLAMVSNKEIIESCMSVESCQRALTVESELKFASTTIRSSVLHIAVTHRNVHFVYAILSDFPEITRGNPPSKKTEDPIKPVDISHPSTNQTLPIDIAVHEQDITMTLLLLSFHDKLNSLPGQEKKEDLLAKTTPKPESDAITKSKMAAIQKVLQESSIPSPEEIYLNYQTDESYYKLKYNPPPTPLDKDSASALIQVPPLSFHATCWNCSNTDVKACKQCHHPYCPTCRQKPSHTCSK